MTKTTASARVAQAITEDIAAGRLKVGDRLPTRAELSKQYGIAAMTAARVVRLLSDQGLVVSDVGRGVFVVSVPAAADPLMKADPLHRLEARIQAIEDRLEQLSPRK